MSKHTLPIRRRGGKWQVDARKVGGPQTSYPTKAQAEGAAQAQWDDHIAAQVEAFDFSMERRRLAVAAFRELAEYPDDALLAAAILYRETIPATETARKTVGEVIDEYLGALSQSVAAITLRNDYRPKLGAFKRAFGARDLCCITTQEIEQWMDAEKFTLIYRQAIRNRLVTFWTFAIERNYAKLNTPRAIPRMSRQQRKKHNSRPPAILDATELKALLGAAAAYRDGELVPYFAVCALAGIRPHEARRIGWEDVSFTDKEIRIPSEASKTGDPREVPMSDNLIAWLETVPEFRRHGLFPFTRGAFEAVRKNAGLTARWKEPKGSDILRHSAASHDYRMHDNMQATAAKMGHDVQVFRQHYKRVVATRDEASAYFNVMPDACSNVVLMQAAG